MEPGQKEKNEKLKKAVDKIHNEYLEKLNELLDRKDE